jgi:hypothetical protein
MKTWKLVSGIISIAMCLLVLFQSCFAGLGDVMINALDKNASSSSGVAGVFVAFLMMSGGIVSIVTRNWSKGGNIAMVVLYGLAALIGYTSFGFFKDLIVWATWCLVCAVLAVISLLRPPVLQSNKNFSKAGAPIPAPVQREFTYTSKDMVRAEAMSSYVTRFEFNFGLTEKDCSKLFSFVERAVSPDVEVVSAFIAKKNGTPCACAMAISKLIIADDWKTRTIQTLDILGFTYENGTLTVKSKADDIILSVSAQRGQAVCDVCNQSLIACKKEIESNSKVNV